MMNPLMCARLYLIITFVALSQAGSAIAAEFDMERLAPLTPALQKFVDDRTISGAVVGVGTDQGAVHYTTVGRRNLVTDEPMTTDTVFRIASMTKPMVAMTIMQLVQAGKLTVDDPVAQHLPEFTGQLLMTQRAADGMVTLKPPARPITIRDLLTHTSGLPGSYPEAIGEVYRTRQLTLAEGVYLQSQRPLEFEPGSKWAYCNAGIDTLGRIIEVVTGQAFEQALQRQLFEPLGMGDTTSFVRPDQRRRVAELYEQQEGRLVPVQRPLIGLGSTARHPAPAGGLCSTATDLARLYQCLLNQGRHGSQSLLSPDLLAEMTRTQTGELKTGFVDGMSFGYGFQVVKVPQGVTGMLSPGTYGHGGAFGTQGWIDPQQGIFIIFLIQRTGLPNADGSEMRRVVQEIVVSALRK
jgi:CubicO group peptidase (beta-lactamase class C family)